MICQGNESILEELIQLCNSSFQNGHPSNPYCEGVEGVMQAYQRTLSTVQLYGPTNFAPVVNHVARLVTSSSTTRDFFDYAHSSAVFLQNCQWNQDPSRSQLLHSAHSDWWSHHRYASNLRSHCSGKTSPSPVRYWFQCTVSHSEFYSFQASSLPISIIIVGIGDADFEAMNVLDGDDVRLSSRGRYAERDIVQVFELVCFWLKIQLFCS